MFWMFLIWEAFLTTQLKSGLVSHLQLLSLLVLRQFSSVAQPCLTLCDPMNHSTPGLPVVHQLPELTQTHVHWVSDAIQPSHPLSSPSSPALNLSQHQVFSYKSALLISIVYSLTCLLSQFSSVQLLSRIQLFATPWIAEHQASLSITNSRSSLRLMSIESVMPPTHFILCRPLILLPPIPPSIRVFSNESTLRLRWPSTGVSALASFLPNNTQGWSPSEWTGWISL